MQVDGENTGPVMVSYATSGSLPVREMPNSSTFSPSPSHDKSTVLSFYSFLTPESVSLTSALQIIPRQHKVNKPTTAVIKYICLENVSLVWVRLRWTITNHKPDLKTHQSDFTTCSNSHIKRDKKTPKQYN